MKKLAFIFPGQGAQYVGMGKEFFDAFPVVRELFEEADDRLSKKLSKIIFEGPEEALTETLNSQLAIFVVSFAIHRAMSQQMPDLKPAVCSGLSLGEYTALATSGRLGFADTLKLVQTRAHLMQEACLKAPGTMAAVLGLDGKQVEEGIKELKGVWLANYNAPGQIVISGTKEGVMRAGDVLKERGAKRVIPLVVSGSFHSALMQSAQDGLAPCIAAAPIVDSEIDFVMNVPGALVQEPQEIKKNLTAQVTRSVRWEQGILAMKGMGVELFIEIGCGKTLSGLNRKIGVPGVSVERPADLEQLHRTLELACNIC